MKGLAKSAGSWMAAGVVGLTPSWAAEPVTALAFRPDGRVLASGRARLLEFRDPGDGHVVGTTPVDLPKVGALTYAPSGQWLAVAGGIPGESGRWVSVEGATGVVRGSTVCGSDQALAVAVDTQGERVAVGGADRMARIWRVDGAGGVEAGERGVLTLRGHTGPVLGVAFAAGGRQVLTASADRTLGVWSAADGRRLRTLSLHTDAVTGVAIRPGVAAAGDRWECASSGADRSVRVWQPEIGRMVRSVRGHAGSVLALGYGADGGRLYSLGTEGILRCFEATSDAQIWERRVSRDWGYALAVHPLGFSVATADATGGVTVTGLDTNGLPR